MAGLVYLHAYLWASLPCSRLAGELYETRYHVKKQHKDGGLKSCQNVGADFDDFPAIFSAYSFNGGSLEAWRSDPGQGDRGRSERWKNLWTLVESGLGANTTRATQVERLVLLCISVQHRLLADDLQHWFDTILDRTHLVDHRHCSLCWNFSLLSGSDLQLERTCPLPCRLSRIRASVCGYLRQLMVHLHQSSCCDLLQ